MIDRVRAVLLEHHGGNTVQNAAELGISQQAVHRWTYKAEADHQAWGILRALWETWGISPAWVITGLPPKYGPPQAGDPGYARGVRDVVDRIGRGPLTEAIERELLAVVEAGRAAAATAGSVVRSDVAALEAAAQALRRPAGHGRPTPERVERAEPTPKKRRRKA
ncbi:MAG TPA: hypothetical protein VFS11_10310 [Gemmatimonadales bacterium]|nr:hypothetical protein [Gemmatimonadales bacterium]